MSSSSSPSARIAVILGTNEIASAVAVYLRRMQYAVVMVHDPLPPVIRRGMAFYDALFEDFSRIDEIKAIRVDELMDFFPLTTRPDHVAVTALGLTDLLVLGSIDVIVDARMQKRVAKPCLFQLADLTIGLGPGFAAKINCDVAIETKPDCVGAILDDGTTAPWDGVSAKLNGLGAERFVYSIAPGRWRTALDVGTRVYKDLLIGRIGDEPVIAPMDGLLRGIVRDGIEVPAGVKLLEIDPRGPAGSWTKIDARAQSIARATVVAIDKFSNRTEPEKAAPAMRLR